MADQELLDSVSVRYESLKEELALGPFVAPKAHTDQQGCYSLVSSAKSGPVALIACPNRPVYFIHGAIREKWLNLGGLDGMLGYPTSDEVPYLFGSKRIGALSHFEGGTLVWFDGENGVAVFRGDGSLVESQTDSKCITAARRCRLEIPTALDERVNRLYEIAYGAIESLARVQTQMVLISNTISELAEKQFHYTVSESASRNLEHVLKTTFDQAHNGIGAEVGVKGFKQRGEMKASRDQSSIGSAKSSFSGLFEQEAMVAGKLRAMVGVLATDVSAKTQSKEVETVVNTLEKSSAAALSTSFEGTYELEIQELAFKAGERR